MSAVIHAFIAAFSVISFAIAYICAVLWLADKLRIEPAEYIAVPAFFAFPLFFDAIGWWESLILKTFGL